MSLRKAAFVCVVGLLWASPSVARGDRITTKDGKRLECVIVSEDAKTVQARTGSGALFALPRSQIVSIEKGSEKENRTLEAESLFRARKYPEALEAYGRALSDAPEELTAKEREIKSAWDSDIRGQIANESQDALEREVERLRQEIRGDSLDRHGLARARRRLANALIPLSRAYKDKVAYARELECLQEARELCPDVVGLTPLWIRSVCAAAVSADYDRIKPVVAQYIADCPDDIDTLEFATQQAADRDPWWALSLAYPEDRPHPKATEAMKRLLPKILLACFNSRPYPKDARFDRIACFEHYLRWVPEADRTPLICLRIERGQDVFEDVLAYADWCVSRQDYPTAFYAYRAAQDRAKGDEGRRSVARKAAALEERYVARVSRDVEISQSKGRCDQAHLQALAGLAFFPESRGLLDLKREKTAARDLCAACQGEGATPCSQCGSSGSVVVRERWEPCKRCGGRGELKPGDVLSRWTQDTPVFRMEWEQRVIVGGPCDACRGYKGTTHTDRGPCPTCNAHGRVTCSSCSGKTFVSRQTPRSDAMPAWNLPKPPAWLCGLLQDGASAGDSDSRLFCGAISLLRGQTAAVSPPAPEPSARQEPALPAAIPLAEIPSAPAPSARSDVPPKAGVLSVRLRSQRVRATSTSDRSTVAFENQSGEPVLVKLIGPTYTEIEAPDASRQTVEAAPGRYCVEIRCGRPGQYRYAQSEEFEVIETATSCAAIEIALHKVVAGDSDSRPISEEESQPGVPSSAKDPSP